MMQHIVVDVQDQEKADLLFELLDALDFVTFIRTEDMTNEDDTQDESSNHSREFFSYAGLWAERDITIHSIRQHAWPRQHI